MSKAYWDRLPDPNHLQNGDSGSASSYQRGESICAYLQNVATTRIQWIFYFGQKRYFDTEDMEDSQSWDLQIT